MPVNPNDMTAYRKKKKQRTRLYKLLAVGLFVIGVFVIVLNAEEIFEPLRGIASKIDNTTSDEEGFPVSLSGSAGYSLGVFGNGFILLSDTYLYTYNALGKQIYALQHSYSNPMYKANDRRILLYDHNSYNFSLYNKTSCIYKTEVEGKIITASLGGDDSAAVVTTSPLYSNLLFIYNGNGKLRYTKRFVDEEVNNVYFTDKSSEIIVATSGVRNGDIVSYVYRIRTDIEDGIIWKSTLPLNSWALRTFDNGTNVSVLCDNLLISLDSLTGEETGKYSFQTGALQKPVLNAKLNLLQLYDDISGGVYLNVLTGTAEILSVKHMPQNLKQVEISGEIVYTLEGNVLKSYDSFLNEIASYELDEEYESFIKLGNDILLLGYDKVSSVTLN